MTKAHQARLCWETKNFREAQEERMACDQRRSERQQQHLERVEEGRVRCLVRIRQMAQTQQLSQDVLSRRRVSGDEVRKQLEGLKLEAGRQHAEWAADVAARSERLGTARSLRTSTGSSHGIRRSRSADQLRKARVAHEGRADRVRIEQHVEDARRVDAQQNRAAAELCRLRSLKGVAAAQARVRAQVRLMARETHAEVHQWRKGRHEVEAGYLDSARASRRDVERTRRRCAKALAKDLSARAANAKAVRVERKAADAARQRMAQEHEASKRVVHDRIAREKLA